MRSYISTGMGFIELPIISIAKIIKTQLIIPVIIARRFLTILIDLVDQNYYKKQIKKKIAPCLTELLSTETGQLLIKRNLSVTLAI